MNFAVPADHRVKIKEREKRDKYLNFGSELTKSMEHEGDCNTNCNWYARFKPRKDY